MVGVIAVLAIAVTGAQTQRQKPDELLHQVVTQPTGENGYEEFILAAASIKYSNTFGNADANDKLTLDLKRDAVSRNQRVFQLLRQGLKKPVRPPREHVTFATMFPELARFRELAKLIAYDEEVDLADGRVAAALSSWRDGSEFSRRIQMSTLIGGLVGIACESIITLPLARHLDQLGYSDCHRLQDMVTELLTQPDPAAVVMDGELETIGRMLTEMAQKPKPSLDELVGGLDEPDPGQPDPLEVFRKSPELLPQALREAADLVAKRREAVRAEMAKPTWERKMPTGSAGATGFGEALFKIMDPAWDTAADRLFASEVRLRLLGTHAAILASRWWNGNPPEKLDDLKLGDLAVDPFSGKQFPYLRQGYAYKLYSVGDGRSDHGGHAGDSSSGGTGDLFLIKDGSR